MKRRNAIPRGAPAGLRAAFAMMALDGVNRSAETATATYPHARRIVSAALTNGDEGAVVDELEAAAAAMFPNLENGDTPVSAAQEAAFNVGFAVCWLLLQAVNGKDR
jgi:hypothetical protein